MSVIIGLSVFAIFTVLLGLALFNVSGKQSELERFEAEAEKGEDDAEVH